MSYWFAGIRATYEILRDLGEHGGLEGSGGQSEQLVEQRLLKNLPQPAPNQQPSGRQAGEQGTGTRHWFRIKLIVSLKCKAMTTVSYMYYMFVHVFKFTRQNKIF